MKNLLTDFRSDTVTRPSKAMREAMANADVGDDVFGDDPTVNRLQKRMAELTGMDDALFFPSGTQSNLASLLSHCQRGDEYIVGQDAHTYKYEAGGGAVLGSIQPQPIEFEPDSTLDLAKVAEKIKPDDPHFAKTRLLCLENTRSGDVLPLQYQQQAQQFSKEHGLKLHLDGARVFNAACYLNTELDSITQYYDSVSICFSKGLGSPVGSVLCGSREFIQQAHRWRKMVGGGMRQCGVLAAAADYALNHHVHRLQEDHDRAHQLAEALSTLDFLHCDASKVQTNIFFFRVNSAETAELLRRFLLSQGILIGDGTTVRIVTHLDISDEAISKTIQAFQDFQSSL